MSDTGSAQTGNSTYYGPTDESSSDILLEKTFLDSGYLTGVGYGKIHLLFTLYICFF